MLELIKAIVVAAPGDAAQLQWCDIPMPAPAYEGQVLIRVKAAGVNRPDVLQRQGSYQAPADASPILGLEVAGVVEQVYGSAPWQYGDAVCALTHGGGYAEYVWADARHCLPVPEGWTFAEAASLPETYFTVWFNVFQLGRLGSAGQETLLVHAGASGIGVAAIQIAKALGQRVIVTARRAAQLRRCVELGADAAFLLDEQADWVNEVVRGQGGGADVVLDMLGERTFAGNLSVLKPGGRLVWLAFLTGAKVTLAIPAIMKKQVSLTGSLLRPQPAAVKAGIASALRSQVWPWLAQGKIRPVVQAIIPIRNACKAHELMEAGGHVGKIVLEVNSNTI